MVCKKGTKIDDQKTRKQGRRALCILFNIDDHIRHFYYYAHRRKVRILNQATKLSNFEVTR